MDAKALLLHVKRLMQEIELQIEHVDDSWMSAIKGGDSTAMLRAMDTLQFQRGRLKMAQEIHDTLVLSGVSLIDDNTEDIERMI